MTGDRLMLAVGMRMRLMVRVTERVRVRGAFVYETWNSEGATGLPDGFHIQQIQSYFDCK